MPRGRVTRVGFGAGILLATCGSPGLYPVPFDLVLVPVNIAATASYTGDLLMATATQLHLPCQH